MRINLLCILFCGLFSLELSGQDSLHLAPSPINHSKLRTVILTESALYLGSMAYLQFIWYK
ncbi:MAG: hypothetical protein AAF388_11910, partial [Bacteroidota bacterium]